MSKDGYLPDNINEWDLPGEDERHLKSCPCYEEVSVWTKCGGVGECVCYPFTLWGRAWRWLVELYEMHKWGELSCQENTDPECICSEIIADDQASYADHLRDLREDR